MMTGIELQSVIIMNPLPFKIGLFKGTEKQAELNYETITARTLQFDRITYDYFEEPIRYRYPGNETIRVPAGSIVLFSLSDELGELNLWYQPLLNSQPITITFIRELG